jgi:hypothetical protein
MENLRIDAASPESAHAMLAKLSEFETELVESPRGYQVVVALKGNDADIVGVLNALQQYVTERSDGPARVELSGRSYVMHPEPDSTFG